MRAAQTLKELGDEIVNLKMRVQLNCQNGSEALKRNLFGEAFIDFRSSARGGYAEGMLRLGDMYKTGVPPDARIGKTGFPGEKADETLARVWWTRAALAHNLEANERLRQKLPPIPFPVGHSG